MGVEYEIYNPARDATFELGKGLWDIAPPSANTEAAWLAVIEEAMRRRYGPDDEQDRAYYAALAVALVRFCEPDVSACWVAADCGCTASEWLGRDVPKIGTRYATPDALRSWRPPVG